MALVKITTSGNDVGKTELLDVKKCEKQWNNNTFTVTKTGAIFVTNGGRMHKDDTTADSYLWKVSAQKDKDGVWSIHVSSSCGNRFNGYLMFQGRVTSDVDWPIASFSLK